MKRCLVLLLDSLLCVVSFLLCMPREKERAADPVPGERPGRRGSRRT